MATPQYPDVNVTLDNYIATVEINAVPLNYLSVSLLENLVSIWEWADSEPDCRVIILTAAGKVFSAGANFADFIGEEEVTPEPLYKLALRLFEGRTPVIAAVQGAAVGAGLGLAMVADERVAGPKAKFSANFVQLGFHPGFGLTASLPHVLGAQQAGSLLMSAKRVKAEEALALGLVAEVSDENNLMDVARRRASEIAKNAPLAVQDLRCTLRAPLVEAVGLAVKHELAIQLNHFRTKDFSEGVDALFNQRDPVFIGE